MEVLLGKTLEELQSIVAAIGLPKFSAKQISEWLYVKRVCSFDEMTNISKKGRELLALTYCIGRHDPVAKAISVDGTEKYLFKVSLNDKEQFIETVYIPDEDRATLCVSTQAGCKMGCKFCMTGTLGFHGHLSAADILNQIFSIDAIHNTRLNNEWHLTNLVYMGEGEPCDNIDNVLRSLNIMTAPYACAWSPRRITVSSVGYMPGLQRFLDESECHLAISLHNPFGVDRQTIMPIEKAYPIADVLELLRNYDFSHQRRLSFEYICWGGHNDSLRHANALRRLLSGLDCRINLIRFHSDNSNDQTSSYTASDEQQMIWFRDYLTENGITTTIRRSRGEDILAACGMLVNALKK